MTRSNTSFAVVCMVKSNDTERGNSTTNSTNAYNFTEAENSTTISPNALNFSSSIIVSTVTSVSPAHGAHCEPKDKDDKKTDGPFEWGKDYQNYAIQAFYYGYMLTQIPGGILARYTGPKMIIFALIVASGVLNLLSPISAYGHFWLFFMNRFFLGVVQGPCFACMQQMVATWAPPLERSILCAITYTGSQFGVVLSMLLSGILCSSLTWDSIYYFFGGAALLWSILWFVYAANNPDQQKCISDEEKAYIEEAVAESPNRKPVGGPFRCQHPLARSFQVPFCQVPWGKLFTSVPFWAVCAAQFSMDYGAYTMISTLPQFADEVLCVGYKKNSYASSAPYVAKMVMILVSGWVADKVQKCGWLSTVWTRRVFMIAAAVGQCGFLMGCVYLPKGEYTWAVVLLCLSVGFSGCQYSAHVVSYIDIAPQYTAITVGIGNTISSATGFIGPALNSAMTHEKTPEQWQQFYGASCGIILIGATIYVIFIQGHVQPWAVIEDPVIWPSTTNTSLATNTSTSKPDSDSSGPTKSA
ncbi:Major Facilitator Superfamily protein [Aphelenchoides avenae]|nr:Major Facilitator Superfamily protein [Aphelenchus avenae]